MRSLQMDVPGITGHLQVSLQQFHLLLVSPLITEKDNGCRSCVFCLIINNHVFYNSNAVFCLLIESD